MHIHPKDTGPTHGWLTRRQYLQGAGLAVLGVALAPVLQAFAGAVGLTPKPASAEALLLAPADFAGASLRQVQRLGQRETRDGGQTAQVVLENDRLKVFQSVVVFPSEDAARGAFRAVNQTGAGELWNAVPEAPSFGQESVVLQGKQGTQDAIAAVFRQGTVQMRVTLAGATDIAELAHYVRKAEERAKG